MERSVPDHKNQSKKTKPSRCRKLPIRYGTRAKLDISDSTEGDFSADSSDNDFDPSTDVPSAKRPRAVASVSGQISNILDINNVSEELNFDEEFDEIKIDQISCSNGMSSSDNNHIPEVDISTVKNPLNRDCMVDGNLISELHKNTVEILARIAIIEKTLIKKGSMAIDVIEDSKPYEFIEKINSFSKSNRLPLTNIEDMKIFNENLGDQSFRKVAVRSQVNSQ